MSCEKADKFNYLYILHNVQSMLYKLKPILPHTHEESTTKYSIALSRFHCRPHISMVDLVI